MANAINIKLDAKVLQNSKQLNLHYMPVGIKENSTANIKQYFDQYTREQPDGILSNSLRGYPLYGVEMQVPNGYQGLVLEETNRSLCEEKERTLQLKGTFDKFKCWNYDRYPNKNDTYQMAMQFLPIAAKLAKPLTESQVLDELNRLKEQKLKQQQEEKNI